MTDGEVTGVNIINPFPPVGLGATCPDPHVVNIFHLVCGLVGGRGVAFSHL